MCTHVMIGAIFDSQLHHTGMYQFLSWRTSWELCIPVQKMTFYVWKIALWKIFRTRVQFFFIFLAYLAIGLDMFGPKHVHGFQAHFTEELLVWKWCDDRYDCIVVNHNLIGSWMYTEINSDIQI